MSRKFFGFLAILVFSALLVPAQAVKGTLVGTISDQQGAPVAAAEVRAVEAGTQVTRTVSSDEQGNYSVLLVDAGSWTISVKKAGFKTASVAGVILRPNSVSRTDVVLELGQITESVTVAAVANDLQTDRVDVGRKIEATEMRELPLTFNRNYQGLLMLAPGVSRPFRPHSEFYNSQDHLSVNVNGQIRHGSSSLVEGIDNNWDDGNLSILVPPVEAIQTVDVVTSNYDAEFGRATGAVTNVILNSGTNQFHGSLFAFNRVSALRARNFFSATRPPQTYNLFGGTIGGRIVPNKTFFFADFQGVRDRLGSTTRITVPSSNFRSGNLASSPTEIYDPLTGTDSAGRGRTPFPGRVIPGGRISPISSRILAAMATPSNGDLTNNYLVNLSRAKDNNAFDVKVDHILSEKHSFFVRYSYQRPEVLDPPLYGDFGGPRAGGFAGSGLSRIQSPGLNWVATLNPTLVAEFRFGLARVRNDALPTSFGTTTARDIGIPGANIDEWSSGMSSIHIDGYDAPMVGFSASLPWRRAQTNFNLVNNWTKVAGRHTVKVGGSWQRQRNDLLQTQAFNPRGRFNFAAGPTALNGNPQLGFANAFASFLLDQPISYGRDLYVQFPTSRQWFAAGYINDKFQVSPKLTLDLGLRYELWPPSRPRFDNGYAGYDLATNQVIVSGMGGIAPDLGFKTSNKNFAPRLGFAYRIRQGTVIRAGYGISYLFRPTGGAGYPLGQANVFEPVNSFTSPGAMRTGFPAPVFLPVPQNGRFTPPVNVGVGVSRFDMPQPYVQSWNLAIQHKLPANFLIDVAYVGNVGINYLVNRNINASQVPGSGAATQPLNILYGRTNGVGQLEGSTTRYNSMQVKLDRRFTKGLALTTAYTWSKAMDVCSDRYCGPLIQTNFELNRARTDFDRTHILTQSFIYDLPLAGNGGALRRKLLGGWQMNGIFMAQTGAPVDVTISNASLNMPGNGNRPDISALPNRPMLVGPGLRWFDTSVFSAPSPNRFGYAGRNLFSGPGLVNLDASLFRNFTVRERYRLQFRAEAFNVTNTPHFNNPGGGFGSPTFGVVTSGIDDSRGIQLGLKMSF
jgi:hypothetical protein